MNIHCRKFGRIVGAALVCAISTVRAEDLDEVLVVTSRLRDVALDAIPASVTVLPQETIARAGLQHFEDVLSLVPNLNWSARRARPTARTRSRASSASARVKHGRNSSCAARRRRAISGPWAEAV